MSKLGQHPRKIVVALLTVVAVIATVVLWPKGAPATTEPLPPPGPTMSVEPPSDSPSPVVRSSPEASPSPSVEPTPLESSLVVPDKRPGLPRPVEPSTGGLAAQECVAPSGSFVPTKFTIERVGAHERVVSMGMQSGQIPAPPLSDRRSAAWWKGGPKPGSAQGKVVLTIHTYRPSLRPALGNELYAGGHSTLQPGDIVKLHGSNGEIACYRFTEAPKIHVNDYDPDSTVMLDPNGPSSLVIVICWDFNSRTKDWDTRVMFQFEAIT